MKTTTIALLCASAASFLSLTSCQPSLGSDMASRDNPNNMLSDAQHRQRNLQRQDTINEVQARDAQRHDTYEQVNSPLRTASDALGNMGAARSNFEWLTR
ncbi:MAG: hypothetical protein EOP88_21640 [Verrucomicrobiaceae bacterium]|nr:MAG: hypothetical protein EOP88_21640 [Verrucomicrobiaceae bacterium]